MLDTLAIWRAWVAQPMTEPRKPNRGRQGAIAAAIAAAAVVALPIKKQWEGLSLTPYRDIVGVETVCWGETRVEMRRYTAEECERLAVDALAKDFGPGVVACVPGLGAPERRNQLAASMVLAYNIGSAGFCRSTAARRFNAGQWRAGCDAFLLWNRAGGREVRGLTNRRRAERELCLRGL